MAIGGGRRPQVVVADLPSQVRAPVTSIPVPYEVAPSNLSGTGVEWTTWETSHLARLP